jgi:hypothetical protein
MSLVTRHNRSGAPIMAAAPVSASKSNDGWRLNLNLAKFEHPINAAAR